MGVQQIIQGENKFGLGLSRQKLSCVLENDPKCVSMPWSAASTLLSGAMHPPANRVVHQSTSRRQPLEPGTPIIRYAKSQVPSRTSRNGQTLTNRQELSGAIGSSNQWSGAVRSCNQRSGAVKNRHQPSGAIRSYNQLSGTITNCQEGGPPIFFIGYQCGWSLKQTSAKFNLPIGALLHVTSNHQFSRSYFPHHRARCNSQPTQA